MTAVREIRIKCDYGMCLDWIQPRTLAGQTADTVAEARKLARKQGWRTRKVVSGRVSTEDRCPRHATMP